MELLKVLSKPTSRRRKRKTRFLLPETEAEFVKCKAKALELRAQRLSAIFVYVAECFAQAKTLRNEACQFLSVSHENDAEYELARRDAKQRKDEAKKLRKKGRTFRSRAWWLTLCFWKFPQELDVAKDYPPDSYQSCHWWAWDRASSMEAAKIVDEGEVLHKTLTPAKKNEYWHHERRLIRYRDHIFLGMLSKRVDAQPHDPWQVDWVTESTSQMTEEELRLATAHFD